MSDTKQDLIIAGGVIVGSILLAIGKKVWDRYTEVTFDTIQRGGQANPNQSVGEIVTPSMYRIINGSNSEESEEDNQLTLALARKILAGSSRKSKKHKRRTRRRVKKN